jgi:hypothetical protein
VFFGFHSQLKASKEKNKDLLERVGVQDGEIEEQLEEIRNLTEQIDSKAGKGGKSMDPVERRRIDAELASEKKKAESAQVQ